MLPTASNCYCTLHIAHCTLQIAYWLIIDDWVEERYRSMPERKPESPGRGQTNAGKVGKVGKSESRKGRWESWERWERSDAGLVQRDNRRASLSLALSLTQSEGNGCPNVKANRAQHDAALHSPATGNAFS